MTPAGAALRRGPPPGPVHGTLQRRAALLGSRRLPARFSLPGPEQPGRRRTRPTGLLSGCWGCPVTPPLPSRGGGTPCSGLCLSRRAGRLRCARCVCSALAVFTLGVSPPACTAPLHPSSLPLVPPLPPQLPHVLLMCSGPGVPLTFLLAGAAPAKPAVLRPPAPGLGGQGAAGPSALLPVRPRAGSSRCPQQPRPRLGVLPLRRAAWAPRDPLLCRGQPSPSALCQAPGEPFWGPWAQLGSQEGELLRGHQPLAGQE